VDGVKCVWVWDMENIKWIYKEQESEASNWLRRGNLEVYLKCFDEFSGGIKCGRFLD